MVEGRRAALEHQARQIDSVGVEVEVEGSTGAPGQADRLSRSGGEEGSTGAPGQADRLSRSGGGGEEGSTGAPGQADRLSRSGGGGEEGSTGAPGQADRLSRSGGGGEEGSTGAPGQADRLSRSGGGGELLCGGVEPWRSGGGWARIGGAGRHEEQAGQQSWRVPLHILKSHFAKTSSTHAVAQERMRKMLAGGGAADHTV